MLYVSEVISTLEDRRPPMTPAFTSLFCKPDHRGAASLKCSSRSCVALQKKKKTANLSLCLQPRVKKGRVERTSLRWGLVPLGPNPNPSQRASLLSTSTNCLKVGAWHWSHLTLIPPPISPTNSPLVRPLLTLNPNNNGRPDQWAICQTNGSSN